MVEILFAPQSPADCAAHCTIVSYNSAYFAAYCVAYCVLADNLLPGPGACDGEDMLHCGGVLHHHPHHPPLYEGLDQVVAVEGHREGIMIPNNLKKLELNKEKKKEKEKEESERVGGTDTQPKIMSRLSARTIGKEEEEEEEEVITGGKDTVSGNTNTPGASSQERLQIEDQRSQDYQGEEGAHCDAHHDVHQLDVERHQDHQDHQDEEEESYNWEEYLGVAQELCMRCTMTPCLCILRVVEKRMLALHVVEHIVDKAVDSLAQTTPSNNITPNNDIPGLALQHPRNTDPPRHHIPDRRLPPSPSPKDTVVFYRTIIAPSPSAQLLLPPLVIGLPCELINVKFLNSSAIFRLRGGR